MQLPRKAQLLRIFIGEDDKVGRRSAYEAIVLAAREQGLAGATVLRGFMGFGAASRIHTAKILRLSEDLPVVVEIVDRPDRIQTFLPVLDTLIPKGGLVTLETAEVIVYRHGNNTGGDTAESAG